MSQKLANRDNKMDISIFGLGYVGAVSAACLADCGHNILGVDQNEEKVVMINNGKSPVIEKDLESLIRLNLKANRLKATHRGEKAVLETEVSIICVGTPSLPNGNIDLSSIERVSKEIGEALLLKNSYHIIINRSTVIPGTIKNVMTPIIEQYSQKKVGIDFGIASNPEFLREATAVYDFFNPPKTVIGAINVKDQNKVAAIYKDIKAPLIFTSIETAEMAKYADNAFHALKITFANEIGLLCKKIGIDSHEIMEVFCKDKKLNLSSYYLKPGFAFGGSCLPKDLRSITYFGKHQDLELPVLNSIMRSNQIMIDSAIHLVQSKGCRKIGVLGFAFKAGTDDLRESPVVTLIESLLGKGYKIKIYDKNVSLGRLRGANKKFIEERIPHIAALIEDNLEEVLTFSELIIVGNKSEEFKEIQKHTKKGQYIIDLVRMTKNHYKNSRYEGICW
jgi:GDP-mannose 6-dehydrogenase